MATAGVHSLGGKVAIITGSSSGIGAAIALEFVRLGGSVTLHGRDPGKLKDIAQQCEKVGKKKPFMVTGDITKDDVRVKIINDTVKHFGRLDILVNNAGFAHSSKFMAETDLKKLDDMIDIHIRVPFHLTKLAMPHLVATKGNIINISSVASMSNFPDSSEYSIAKAAMDQMTKFTAFELGPKGVRANTINPGAIKTGFLGRLGLDDAKEKEFLKIVAMKHALHRAGNPEEIARAAGFLASDAASFVTGTIMCVDGGYMVVPPLAGGGEENH